MSKIREFAIVGAGIAGLASAIALSRAGHRVRVFEQAPQIDEVGTGIQIGPNAVHALKLLGVWETLEPDTFAPDQILIKDALSNRMLTAIDLNRDFEQRFGAPYRVAHRASLIARLQEIAEQHASIQIQTDSQFVNYATNDNRLLLQFSGREAVSADALIAADGIHSSARAALLGDGPPDYAGHVIYRALLPMTDVPDSTEKTSVGLWLYPGGHVVHYPVNAGRQLNLVAVAESPWIAGGWQSSAATTEVDHLFAKAVPELRDLLAKPADWRKWAGADRKPARIWSDGPITLIGDAAHPALPYLAQGAAMALEDAVVLGQCCKHCENISVAFQQFAEHRMARAARVVRSSHALGRIYHLRSAAAGARNFAMSALPSHSSMSRLSWLYDWKAHDP